MMRAMILAAGRGERMRPLTDHTPKPLLSVGGKPLIVWHVERLAAAGVRQIVINHAHLGAQIESALGDGRLWGVHIRYSPETQALETAGGIAQALPHLGDAPFLVVNGDTFSNIAYGKLQLPAHMLAHLVMVSNPTQHPQGDFALVGDRLDTIHTPRLTFSGVGVYHPALFAQITPGNMAKLAPLLSQAMVQGQVSGEHHQGIWHDIGTPERLLQLDAWLASPAAQQTMRIEPQC